MNRLVDMIYGTIHAPPIQFRSKVYLHLTQGPDIFLVIKKFKVIEGILPDLDFLVLTNIADQI